MANYYVGGVGLAPIEVKAVRTGIVAFPEPVEGEGGGPVVPTEGQIWPRGSGG